MTYTTEQVVQLNTEYLAYLNYHIIDNPSNFNGLPFNEWLKERESFQTPVKGQKIWVRNNSDSRWYERYFYKFDEDVPSTIHTKNDEGTIGYYSYYSLTNPNV